VDLTSKAPRRSKQEEFITSAKRVGETAKEEQGQGRLADLDKRNSLASFTVHGWILKQADRSQMCFVCVVQLELRVCADEQ
jgi:hypothetical protein